MSHFNLSLAFLRKKQIRHLLYTKHIIFLYCLFISLTLVSQSTNIGTPFTTNYLNKVYDAGTQNWDIQQHPNGFLFFANNNGLLQFDGTNWQTFLLPNKTIARSLHISTNGKIYIGGQGEFGYFEPTEVGQLIYHSLLDIIPEAERNFSDVWEIVEYQDRIYFNASDKVYEVVDNKVNVYENGKVKFIGKGHQRLFIGSDLGVFELVNGNIEQVEGGALLQGTIVRDMVERENGQLFFFTKSQGVFELTKAGIRQKIYEGETFLKEHEIYCVTAINEDLLAVGVISEGLVIMDNNGRFIHHLNKKNGLQNNNVLSIFKDKGEDLWLGLDNGVDYVAMHAPFTKLLPDGEQEGTAYAASILNNQLYLGTATGIYQQNWQAYYNPLQENNFKLVKGSEGQVWSLNQIENRLLVGHNEGGFVLRDNQLKRLSSSLGNWTFLHLSKHPNYLVAGTYEGLELYQKNGVDWTFVRKYEGFKESCRLMEQDNAGNIWIAHPYRGIYKIELSADLVSLTVSLYGEKDGLPSDNLNHVSMVNGEVIFTGETGVFKYNAAQNRFVHDEVFEGLIGKEQSIQRLFEDAKGNIWFSTTDETGVLKVEDKGFSKAITKIVYPELDGKLVRGFEFIYPYDEHNVFIGAEKGFIHFNPSKSGPSADSLFTTNIVKVESINGGDSTLLFGQYRAEHNEKQVSFSCDRNAFRFSYTAPNFPLIENLQYSTKLEGFDKDWSSWSTKTEKEYTNLGAGDYRFLVQAKTDQQHKSQMASYTFSIDPPWYASLQAILLYSLLGLLLLGSLIFIPRRRYKKEQAILIEDQAKKEKEHQAVVAESEKQIITLKNENLKTEINRKNRELALTTMHLVRRNELIVKLQEPLRQVLRKTTDKVAITEIKRINKLLSEDAALEGVWDQFAHHFDQVHIDFLKRIRETYPQLTANDQKLCAYLRMNLTTKEIAPLMNISIRGVEVGRYRLRKKLNLDSGVNLNEFMLSV